MVQVSGGALARSKQRRPASKIKSKLRGEIGSTQFFEQGLMPCSFFLCTLAALSIASYWRSLCRPSLKPQRRKSGLRLAHAFMAASVHWFRLRLESGSMRSRFAVTCYDSSGSPRLRRRNCSFNHASVGQRRLTIAPKWMRSSIRAGALRWRWRHTGCFGFADRIGPCVLPQDEASLKNNVAWRQMTPCSLIARSFELGMHLNRRRCTTRVRAERRTAGSGNGFIVRHCSSNPARA